jgi:lactoylglutathione lyase
MNGEIRSRLGGITLTDDRDEPPRIVGVNHVALEVGDIEEALAFYGRIFSFDPPERVPGMAFIDMGDQFLALSEGTNQAPESSQHFGLVVDDKEAVRAALAEAGVDVSPGRRLNFRDPWGNMVQVVDYRDIQFTKAPEVLRAMRLNGLEKREAALRELAEKGIRS